MKTLKGYLFALVFGAITFMCTLLARSYGAVLDSFYPYMTRQFLGGLAWVTSALPFTIWQTAVYLLVIGLIISIVLMVRRKWQFFRWLGWVACLVSFVWMCHTLFYGLNFYASPLSDNIKLESQPLHQSDLENATIFFRDKANALASQLPRDEEGNLLFEDFATLAQKAGEGFENLKMQGYSVFAGSTLPVKKLQWAKLYSSMGILGVTMPVTAESAVNPMIPNMALPFVMCHEMSHRMSIPMENDANFAGILACAASSDLQFQYSAYYMAYRYCYNELAKADSAALREIHKDASPLLRRDMKFYDDFFAKEENKVTTTVANTVNNAYIQTSGDKNGIASYGQVATQLVNWYLAQTAEDSSVQKFDPFDKDYISNLLGGEGA